MMTSQAESVLNTKTRDVERRKSANTPPDPDPKENKNDHPHSIPLDSATDSQLQGGTALESPPNSWRVPAPEIARPATDNMPVRLALSKSSIELGRSLKSGTSGGRNFARTEDPTDWVASGHTPLMRRSSSLSDFEFVSGEIPAAPLHEVAILGTINDGSCDWYRVKIRSATNQIEVFKRYNDFRTFYDSLKASAPGISSVSFPPRLLVKTEAATRTRQDQLQLFLDVCCRLTTNQLRDFLDPDLTRKLLLNPIVSHPVTDEQAESVLLQTLPQDMGTTAPLYPAELYYTCEGPIATEMPVSGRGVSSWIVSTYPNNSQGRRIGDPICDHLLFNRRAKSLVACVADGCNWGKMPAKAAAVTCQKFVEFMESHKHHLTDAQTIGKLLLKAVSVCHSGIIDCEEDIAYCGTTTFLGGVAAQLVPAEVGAGRAFFFVSVGDCKAFLWSAMDQSFRDLCYLNRCECKDATDCGGRIGPYIDGKDADLRNLEVSYCPCFPGDIVVLVSDGVHDNLDPYALGKSAQDIGVSEAGNPRQVAFNKAQFTTALLKDLITADDSPVTPERITSALIGHCRKTVQPSHEWMAANPVGKLPSDYATFPGKMDHATVLAFEVYPS